MPPNDNVRTLFDESQSGRTADDVQTEPLVAERESIAVPREAPRRTAFPTKLFAIVILLGMVGGAGYFATRMNSQNDQALLTLQTSLSDLEHKVGGLLSSSVDQNVEKSRSAQALDDLRHDNAEIHTVLNALLADVSDLKATVGKNGSAIDAIDAKLKAAQTVAQQARKITAAKRRPNPSDPAEPVIETKPIFPNFALVSIDTFAWQSYAVVRSNARGLVDLGASDALEGWRVVEFDMPGQRVAFESPTGVLRWLTAQP